MSPTTLAIRPFHPDDTSFIFSTWLKSYRNSNFASELSNDVFFLEHKNIITSLLQKPNVIVSVMCEGEDDGHIFGYSVIELLASTSIVHFVYVKHAYRKLGIAKMLINAYIPNFGETTTFISHAPRNLREASCKFKLTYNPYLMR